VGVEDAEPRYLEIDPTYVAARRNLTFPFEKRGNQQGLLDILRPIGGSPPDGCVAYDRELKKKSNLPVWALGINGLVTLAMKPPHQVAARSAAPVKSVPMVDEIGFDRCPTVGSLRKPAVEDWVSPPRYDTVLSWEGLKVSCSHALRCRRV